MTDPRWNGLAFDRGLVEVSHLRGVNGARDMFDYFQWAGNGCGCVTEREADPLFTVIYC